MVADELPGRSDGGLQRLRGAFTELRQEHHEFRRGGGLFEADARSTGAIPVVRDILSEIGAGTRQFGNSRPWRRGPPGASARTQKMAATWPQVSSYHFSWATEHPGNLRVAQITEQKKIFFWLFPGYGIGLI